MAPPIRKRGRMVTKADEWGLFMSYIEDPPIFQMLFNTGGQTLVGGRYIKKSAAWDIAAAYLKGVGFKETSGKNLDKKWARYFAKFKAVKKLSLETGFGLNEKESDAGMTLDEKLEGLCAHFHRIDALFGGRANIQPPAVSRSMGFEHMAAEVEFVPDSLAPLGTENDDLLAHNLAGYRDEATPNWVGEQFGGFLEEQFNESEELDQNDNSEDDMMEDDISVETPSRRGVNNPGTPADVGVGAEENANERTPQAPQQASPLPTGWTGIPSSDNTPPIRNATPMPTASNGTSDKAPGNKAPTRAAASKLRGTDQDRAKMAATLKPSLASVFQESKVQEAAFKLKYIEKKGDWKMKELEDKREARQDDYVKRKFELEFEANEKKAETKKERIHQAKVAKGKMKLELIIAGWAAQKPQEEINSFLGLL